MRSESWAEKWVAVGEAQGRKIPGQTRQVDGETHWRSAVWGTALLSKHPLTSRAWQFLHHPSMAAEPEAGLASGQVPSPAQQTSHGWLG